MSAVVEPTPRFDCPFCRTTSIRCIGRGGRFLHYRCEGCAEVWTAMDFNADPRRLPQPRPVALRYARKD